MIQAINKKHQAKVNRAAAWIIKYNNFNNLRNEADGNGDEKTYNKLNKKCELTFDNYLQIADELPGREKNQLEKLF
jgi:hypothetical protein